MLARQYSLVLDDNVKSRSKRTQPVEKVRDVSVVSKDSKDGSVKPGYKCEVRKSPRAPEYEIHMVKAKSGDYDRLPISVSVKRRGTKKKRSGQHNNEESDTATTDNDSKIGSDITDSEKKDMVGIRVIACYSKDGLYYPGNVGKTKESVYAMVSFNFKKKQKVRTQMIIPISGAIPHPELARGDFVLVRVYNQAKELECYVPGIIEFLPDPRQTPKFYSVLMYNGQTATTMRRHIVKIGRARFDMAVKYIAHIQQARIRNENLQRRSTTPHSQQSDNSQSESKSRNYSQSESRSRNYNRNHRRDSDQISDVFSDRSVSNSGMSSHRSDQSVSQSERSSHQSDRSSRRSDRSSHRSDRSDDGASDRSSQISKGSRRKKKEKYTKRLAKTKDRKQRSSSRKRSRHSSGSRSRSNSRSRTNSSRSKSSRSESRTSASDRSSRTTSRSSSRSRSRSRSRSGSRSDSQERPKSRASFRSYSSAGSSRSRSLSRGSRSTSRSGSRTPTQRSRLKLVGSRSKARSGSSDSDGSTTPCNSPIERPSNPVPKPRPVSPPLRTNSITGNVTRTDIYGESRSVDTPGHSRLAMIDEKDQIINDLQYQLEKQKRKQLRQEQRLVRQARKLNKIESKLNKNHHNDSLRSDKSRSARSSSDDTDTTPQRKRDFTEDTSYGEQSYSMSEKQGRGTPQGPQEGEEVLARWIDDGWYYRGCVRKDKGDNCYVVEDATGHIEEIAREDILLDEDHKLFTIQYYAICLHPKYVFSYAPAEILDTFVNGSSKVEFYDGGIYTVPSEEIYKISQSKYDEVKKYIMDKEKLLVGKSVIARDDDQGTYKLGVIDSHCGLGQLYYIKWLDGMLCKQNANHIFETGQRSRVPDDVEYVLAPSGDRNVLYLPAKVVQPGSTLEFCDGTRSSDVHLQQCYWLSKRYYNNAVEFYLAKNEQ